MFCPVKILKLIQKELPDTDVHCLTNGRSFANRNLTKTLSGSSMDKLMLGIPLYSDHTRMHDYIVQDSGAFDQTMLGFYNLADSGVRIEMRIVLHFLTIPRLGKLARYIYKNLPFVEHVSFMGLEHQGYTTYNNCWLPELILTETRLKGSLNEQTLYLRQAELLIAYRMLNEFSGITGVSGSAFPKKLTLNKDTFSGMRNHTSI